MDLEIPGELIPKPQSATMPATGRMNRNFAARWIYSMAWLIDLMIMLRRISDHYTSIAGNALDIASMIGIYYCCRDQELWWALVVTPMIAVPWLLIKDIMEQRETANTTQEDRHIASQPPPTLNWLNNLIEILWKTHRSFANQVFIKMVWPEIREEICKKSKIGCSLVDMKAFDIGNFPPKISKVSCSFLTAAETVRELLLKMDITFNSNASITLTGLAIPVTVRNIEARIVSLSLLLKRLSPLPPFIGGFQIFLPEEPDITWDTGGMARVTDIPGIESLVDYLIEEKIRGKLVLPNRISLELPKVARDAMSKMSLKGKMEEESHLGHSSALLGVVQVTVIEATGLQKTDSGFEHSTIDNRNPLRLDLTDLLPKTNPGEPYVLVKLANLEHRSPTDQNTLYPKWNFKCEFLVDLAMVGANLEVKVFDRNILGVKSDYLLGKVTINLTQIRFPEEVDKWYSFEGSPGKIHLKLKWIPRDQFE